MSGETRGACSLHAALGLLAERSLYPPAVPPELRGHAELAGCSRLALVCLVALLTKVAFLVLFAVVTLKKK